MQRGTVNLTRGSVWRTMLAFALPILISQTFQQFYSIVDSVIVGNFLGRQALASVSSSGSLNQLLTSLMIGIANGAGVVIARCFGADDRKAVSDAIHTTVAFAVIAGLFITVTGVVLSPVLLRLMGTAEDVMDGSVIYFRNYFLGAAAVMLYNAFTGIMNALGDSRRPLYYLIFASVLNIILDVLFIGGFGMGVGAAAIATAISQAASAVLCYLHLSNPKAEFRLQYRKIRIHMNMMREVIRMGLPTGVQNSMIAVGNVTVQGYINSFGSIAMAGCGVYSKLQGFAFLPIMSFAIALTTFISQNLGAKEYERAKKGARFGLCTSLISAEVIGALLLIFCRPLARLFSSDPEVIEICRNMAIVNNGFFFLLSFAHAIAGICRGCGRATVPMVIMLSIWCVFRIIFISIGISCYRTIAWLYWAYPVTWAISSVFFLIFYLKSDWIHGFENRR